MNLFLLPFRNFTDFIKNISKEKRVFYPFSDNGKSHIIEYKPEQGINPDFTKIRTAENLRHFLFPSRDVVARFPVSFEFRANPVILMGVKNCDLRGIEVYDRVFLNWKPEDNIYKERRENTVIISADCPEPQDTCFCNFVGIKPFPEGISDLNITLVKSGYLIEVFSKKGQDLIDENKGLFIEVDNDSIQERERIRENAIKRLEGINQKKLKEKISELIEKADKNFIHSARDECVECYACLHSCPTCYCFLLSDYKRVDNIERIRTWDACYYASYARVGGGANPRSKIDERFWNRFQCKFNYFYQYEKFFACSGCGRCFVGCSAKIDIREILNKL
jgi:NAD-dependent dihydropyrimidine dehydrogenase PreA subunit|uniref:4Fe-4S ferredoxin-type domain-containing protein n=1 Tax=candidate division WOR-3 bacterium TaxID=2052148 RepID=A0A7V3VU28_UNCW3